MRMRRHGVAAFPDACPAASDRGVLSRGLRARSAAVRALRSAAPQGVVDAQRRRRSLRSPAQHTEGRRREWGSRRTRMPGRSALGATGASSSPAPSGTRSQAVAGELWRAVPPPSVARSRCARPPWVACGRRGRSRIRSAPTGPGPDRWDAGVVTVAAPAAREADGTPRREEAQRGASSSRGAFRVGADRVTRGAAPRGVFGLAGGEGRVVRGGRDEAAGVSSRNGLPDPRDWI
jgi:hypothetical protein